MRLASRMGAIGLIVLGVGAQDSCRPCQALVSEDGGTPAPAFCGDVTAVSRDTFLLYADSLGWAPDHGDLSRRLHPSEGRKAIASIIPETDAQHLTLGDLAKRGRVVGVIVSLAPYGHGIVRGRNYIWVECNPRPRVVIVPQDRSAPVAVLGDFRVIPTSGNDPPPCVVPKQPSLVRTTDGVSASVELYQDRAAWLGSLADSIRKRVEKDKGRAYWVDPAPRAAREAGATLVGELTDGWVQVTGLGCVCVGTKCHS